MNIARCNKGMYARVTGLRKSLASFCDISLHCSAECCDGCVLDLARDRLNGRKITVGRDRKSRLDYIYTKSFELQSHLDLLVEIHRTSRRLFSVAKGRIENCDLVV